MKVSSGTCTRPVASRFAFARRFAASVMTLRVMPDARNNKSQLRQSCNWLSSGGHGARTRNPLRGTTFPVWPLTIRLPSERHRKSCLLLDFCQWPD